VQVTNQGTIYRLDDARSRVTTAYMTSRFVGGALGSAVGAVVFTYAGWVVSSAVGGLLFVIPFAVARDAATSA
jgi:hypothetical protein